MHHMGQLGMKKLAQWVEYEIKISSFEESPEKVRRFGEMILERTSSRCFTLQRPNKLFHMWIKCLFCWKKPTINSRRLSQFKPTKFSITKKNTFDTSILNSLNVLPMKQVN